MYISKQIFIFSYMHSYVYRPIFDTYLHSCITSWRILYVYLYASIYLLPHTLCLNTRIFLPYENLLIKLLLNMYYEIYIYIPMSKAITVM